MRYVCHSVPTPTAASTRRRLLFLLLAMLAACVPACRADRPQPVASPTHAEEEALTRTEFTSRIENYFEYPPLKAGVTSRFLIHVTDLKDGSPVKDGQVTLVARPVTGGPEASVTAQVGRVVGIYVADVKLAAAGNYDIEFHVRQGTLDETMKLTGFTVK